MASVGLPSSGSIFSLSALMGVSEGESACAEGSPTASRASNSNGIFFFFFFFLEANSLSTYVESYQVIAVECRI